MSWIGNQNTMDRGQNTVGKGFNIPYVGGQNAMDRVVKIPWVGVRYNMGRGSDKRWVEDSIYHG